MNQSASFVVLHLEPTPYARLKHIDVIVAMPQEKALKLEALTHGDLNLATDYFVQILKDTPEANHIFKNYLKRCDVDEFGLYSNLGFASEPELEYYICTSIQFPDAVEALRLPEIISAKNNVVEHTHSFINLVVNGEKQAVELNVESKTNKNALVVGQLDKVVTDAYIALGGDDSAMQTIFNLFHKNFIELAKNSVCAEISTPISSPTEFRLITQEEVDFYAHLHAVSEHKKQQQNLKSLSLLNQSI